MSGVKKIFEKSSQNNAESITNLLKETKTNLGPSVYDLSTKHKVIAIFIKWYGCKLLFDFHL